MPMLETHARSLHKASTLSSFQVMDAIPPRDVMAVLNAAGVSFVLVGAYGIVGWLKRPRATEDVDVVVAARHLKKATRSLLDAFPHLVADDQEVVIRLRDAATQDVSIDLIKPTQPLYRVVFKHTVSVELEDQQYRIPSLEMALAMKFGPMVSPNREKTKKYLDAHDFATMARANPDIDMEQLAQLGELVYPGGGKEIVLFVAQARAGETMKL
jgi:hypothetical protein